MKIRLKIYLQQRISKQAGPFQEEAMDFMLIDTPAHITCVMSYDALHCARHPDTSVSLPDTGREGCVLNKQSDFVILTSLFRPVSVELDFDKSFLISCVQVILIPLIKISNYCVILY